MSIFDIQIILISFAITNALSLIVILALWRQNRQRAARLKRDITERNRAEAELRASETRYRGLFEHMQEGFAYCQMLYENDAPSDFIYLAVNPKFEELTGLKDVTGKRVTQVIPGIRESDAQLFEIYGRVAQTGAPEKFEIFLEALQMWFSVSVYSPQPAHFVAVFDVVTERKRAEDNLYRSEERFRVSLKNLPITIFHQDRELRYTWLANPHPGFAETTVLGKTDAELLPADDVQQLTAIKQRVLDTGVGERAEVRTTIGGIAYYYDLIAEPLRDSTGGIVGITCASLEITERKRAEEELRLQGEIAAHLSEGISLVRSVDDVIVYCNSRFEEMFGYAPGELIGKPIAMLNAPDFANPLATTQAIKTSVQKNKSWSGEIHNVRKDGTRLWSHASISQFNHAEHGLVQVAVRQDITERKRAEEALRASEALLRTIAENYPNSYVSIIEKGLTIGFAAGQEFKKQNLDPHQFVGLPLEQVFGESAPIVREKYLETFRGAETQFELFINAQHQLYRTVPLRDSNGDIHRILVVVENITERKRAEAHVRQRAAQLAALHEIDLAISNTFDLRITLDILLRQVVAQLKVDAATVLLFNPHLQMLEYAAGFGFRYPAIQKSQVHLGEGCAGRAALERKIISGTTLAPEEDDCRRLRVELADEQFVAHHVAPLIVKGQVNGVLEIFQRTRREPANGWLDFFQVLAGQAAIGVDNALLFEGLQRSNAELALSYDATLEGWSRALDLRDKETEGHSQRVTEMTVRLARALGMSDAELVHVRRGALLHDIGKLGVPDEILFKPGALTDAEWQVMKQHPKLAFDLIAPIAYLRPALDIPYCHHEKWDGTGYPRRLKGEHIPLAARVFAVVDVWDALRSNRSYRPAWSAEQTRAHLIEQSGKYFDPRVVQTFLELIAGV